MREIEDIMPQSEEAYSFAKLESKHSRHMREQGILSREDRQYYVNKIFAEEQKLEDKTNAAVGHVQQQVEKMEAELKARGIEDE